jgi:hypothetical protein
VFENCAEFSPSLFEEFCFSGEKLKKWEKTNIEVLTDNSFSKDWSFNIDFKGKVCPDSSRATFKLFRKVIKKKLKTEYPKPVKFV